MPSARELASQLSASNISKSRLRAFANHVSQVESDSGVRVKKVLINGIPPFEDVPAVEFDVPKGKLGNLIDKLLASPNVNPNILINGIPSLDHYNVRVIGR